MEYDLQLMVLLGHQSTTVSASEPQRHDLLRVHFGKPVLTS